MSLSERQRRFPPMLANLISFAYENGYELTLGEAYRTEEQQRLYVDSGRSRTMNSRHRDRLAADLNLFKDGVYLTDKERYRFLGERWEGLGGRWGGRFGVSPVDYATEVGWDSNHFELSE